VPFYVFESVDESVLREAVLSFLDSQKPELAAELRTAFAHIAFKPVSSVEKIDTGFKISGWDHVFDTCHRKMLAVQDFDTPSPGFSTVRLVSDPTGKKTEYDKSYHFSQVILKIHEAFIYSASSHTRSLKEMETEARKRTVELYNTPGLDAFLVATTLPELHADPTKLSGDFLSWLQEALVYYPNSGWVPDQVNFNVDEALKAGFDPNYEITSCKLPILDWVIGRYKTYDCVGTMTNCSVDGYTPASASIAFIKRGANVNQKLRDGRSPIHVAAIREDTSEITEALIGAGANMNEIFCQKGKKAFPAMTPLDLARQYSWKNYVYLKAQGAKTARELGATCSVVAPDAPLTREEKKQCRIDLTGIDLIEAPWDKTVGL
jgi:hypothetical protein